MVRIFACGVVIYMAVLTAAVCCRSVEPITVDDLVQRSRSPDLAAFAHALESSSGPQAFAASLPQAFRAGNHLGVAGCGRSGQRGSFPAMAVRSPRIGEPVVISFRWPLPETATRYVLVSSRSEVRPFVQGCALAGPSEWVLPLSGMPSLVTLPALPAVALGSEWILQALQVDPPTEDGFRRVRLSAGVWTKVGPPR